MLKFKSNPWGVIIIYFISMLIGMLVGLLVSGIIASNVYELSFKEVIDISTYSREELDLASGHVIDAYYFMQSWLNFFQYAAMAIAVPFYAKTYIIEDIGVIKKDKKRFFIMLGAAAIAVALMMGFSEIITLITDKISSGNDSTSQNQANIVDMITHGNGVIVFITVFFLAPVVEELVYRKSIFKILDKKQAWLQVTCSAFFFALPHMLSSQSSVLIWILLLLNYLFSGVMLALVYKFSNKNVYASIACHMLNNLVSFLLIV